MPNEALERDAAKSAEPLILGILLKKTNLTDRFWSSADIQFTFYGYLGANVDFNRVDIKPC
jgi:hypothetical protein